MTRRNRSELPPLLHAVSAQGMRLEVPVAASHPNCPNVVPDRVEAGLLNEDQHSASFGAPIRHQFPGPNACSGNEQVCAMMSRLVGGEQAWRPVHQGLCTDLAASVLSESSALDVEAPPNHDRGDYLLRGRRRTRKGSAPRSGLPLPQSLLRSPREQPAEQPAAESAERSGDQKSVR